jgi:signal transduction histidine kinase
MIYILERNNKIRFTFYTNLKERLDHKLEVNLFYLSYEIINNAVKHSKGKEINIQLLSDKESLSLSVEDDGIGFNANSAYNGLGLKNIRQRVKYLEGKLTLDTEAGYGTAIIIEVKL